MGKKKGGKAPQGRAKQKYRAQKSSTNTYGRAAGGDLYSDDDDDMSNVTFRGFGGMSSRPAVPPDPAVKLRYRGIAFVSAGSNTPVEQEEIQVDETLIAAIELNDDDQEEVDEQELEGQMDGAVDIEMAGMQERDVEMSVTHMESATVESMEEQPQFIVDTVSEIDVIASKVPVANIERLLQRPSSPAQSDSSEDVVLFQGRKKAVVIEDPIDSTTASFIKTPSHTSQSAYETDPVSKKAIPGFTPAPINAFWRDDAAQNYNEFINTPAAGSTNGRTSPEAEDTIEMLQAAWKQVKREKKDQKKAVMLEDVSKMNRRGKRGRKRSNRMLQLDPESDDEDAAYQDYLDNLNAQKDDSDVDVQDAIDDVMGAEMDDEQDWEDTANSEDIAGEDVSGDSDSDDDLDDSDLESDELELELTQAEEVILHAEEALYMRRLQSKSDAGIAKLWAKQIELGIDADELIIDDGDELDYEGFGDVAAARAGFEEYIGLGGKRHTSKRSKRRARQDMSFPDASALADTIEQYGNEGFDIMDYERPSLRQTKKGRKGRVPPELEALSDDDLRETMLASWDNDRAKKRLKKAEREELRVQGLLGRGAKKGKVDLARKYHQGLTVEQIYEEIKVFLQDEGKTSQPFPPMHAANRKTLHEIAHALKLKSKSVGAGDSRRPVLYKTQNTVHYSEVSLSRVVNASRRGFLGNATAKGKKTVPMKRGGGGVAAAGLRHGEVVGAGAKEIGRESFGHKLMEKMGWTKGMALGKDGEGVLEPVEQKMRVGRAGLG